MDLPQPVPEHQILYQLKNKQKKDNVDHLLDYRTYNISQHFGHCFRALKYIRICSNQRFYYQTNGLKSVVILLFLRYILYHFTEVY